MSVQNLQTNLYMNGYSANAIRNRRAKYKRDMNNSLLRIGSYSRVSYDEDKERYESIINQQNIVRDYAKEKFQNYEITTYEDDN